MTAPLRIATRGSALALWQANHVADALRVRLSEAGSERTVELVEVSTIGDRNRTDALRNFGGMGAFTKEVQYAVLDGHADLAVHSLKDLPTEPHPGLTLAGLPEREERFDALVLPADAEVDSDHAGSPWTHLNEGAVVGTGSVRRQAQLCFARPDLKLAEIRGNVETRLRKLDEGKFDAILLAAAGLLRLGLADRITTLLRPPEMYPAVGQGILGLECRDDDTTTIELLSKLSDPAATRAALAERSLLRTLRAGCHAPVGVYATEDESGLTLEAVILDAEGHTRIVERMEAEWPTDRSLQNDRTLAEELGVRTAESLIESGGSELLTPTESEG